MMPLFDDDSPRALWLLGGALPARHEDALQLVEQLRAEHANSADPLARVWASGFEQFIEAATDAERANARQTLALLNLRASLVALRHR
jgi:hypothetical protein